jgi:hypothetical protein
MSAASAAILISILRSKSRAVGVPPLERCLACEAVVNKGDGDVMSLPVLRSFVGSIETRVRSEGLVLGTIVAAAARVNQRDTEPESGAACHAL